MCTEIARISCKTFFYTPAKRSLNQRKVGPLQILRRELLPQFLTDSHETWHTCVPWGVDVQDIFFDSNRKNVATVTAYYGHKWGQIVCVAMVAAHI